MSLLLLLVSIISVQSQVVIGSTDDPHSAAVLELKNTTTRGFQQGLLFPQVSLNAASEWFPLDETNGTVEGMVVFNTNETATDVNQLKGKGLYIWINNVWQKISLGDSTNPVPDIFYPESITLDPTRVEISPEAPYNTAIITVKLLPERTTERRIYWRSSDESIATVDNGVITGIAEGTATITAATVNGLEASCIVTVKTNLFPVAGISVLPTTLNLRQGKTETLVATITPANASIHGVEWSSSNPAIASVNSEGVVTAEAIGTATITAKAIGDNSKTATCEVTVEAGVAFDMPSGTPAKGTVFVADGHEWVVLTTDAYQNIFIISRYPLWSSNYASASLGLWGSSDYWSKYCVARIDAENYLPSNLLNLNLYVKKARIKIEGKWDIAREASPRTAGLSEVVAETETSNVGRCFLPSAHEVNTYLAADDPIMGQYRKAAGPINNEYWMRSPCVGMDPLAATRVGSDGEIKGSGEAATVTNGIRVCLWINISGGISPLHDPSRDTATNN
ncbi:MAG: Ig-like domain-containing protein [Bacteroidales bacterium]|nr:Ig-like domain-containing protein [Bacteroidales bacterium]